MTPVASSWQPIIPDAQRHIYSDWHIAPAVRVGGLLLCSGVLGLREDGTLPADPEEQYHQLFGNLKLLLAEAQCDLSAVVDLLSFHLDLANQIGAFSSVKDHYVSQPYPAWTAVEVAGIGAGALPGALAELKATAVLS